jgi:DNA helicase TIP49 (TBP-interacting protein)
MTDPHYSTQTISVNVTLTEYNILKRIRSCIPNIIQIDTRTGAVTVLGKSEDTSNGSHFSILPPEG